MAKSVTGKPGTARARKRDDYEDIVRVGPGTQMGDYMRTFWQPCVVAKDLPPGKALPIRILGEDLTVYRGASGKAFVVGHRCAHRLTLLHTGSVEGDCIRCRYHGWKYDGVGQCVEAPAEDANFHKDVKIAHYPTLEYSGLVFIYMGRGAPPARPYRAELEAPDRLTWASTQIWPCNYLQRIENSLDAVHTSFTHAQSRFGESVTYAIPKLTFEETDWGIRMIAERAANNVRINEFHFPNCNHIVVVTQLAIKARGSKPLWTDIFNWFVPVDDEHTQYFSALASPVQGEEARELEAWVAKSKRYNPADHADELFHGILPQDLAGETASALVNAQDFVVQIGQGSIADRSKEYLGRSDQGVLLLRKILRRESAALRKGRPTKVWKYREGVADLPVPGMMVAARSA